MELRRDSGDSKFKGLLHPDTACNNDCSFFFLDIGAGNEGNDEAKVSAALFRFIDRDCGQTKTFVRGVGNFNCFQ